ncbi:rRNA N6-adenosine-methyltransferase ZCCHC4-like isoform X2 [Rhincodon typus]|uniref:rRNA N6-adenosine-methyltransferase ZCCHC4-like isoform X2 n=1 Tax=Rhincodon typus TaxID=259920 RepID=UPI00202E93D0|nr:rRNA N6-adenosine-methyltransferase ZCCHC4-like isoform X2 [Rhincodon typus]
MVDYDNHALYKHGKTGRKQSPVRIFTNLPPKDITLPAEEGYRFCSLCQRYVSSANRHCEICQACTSKDGRQWKHCKTCNRCVKPSWIHCDTCCRCVLKEHSCGKAGEGCFICGSSEHKRRECPRTAILKRTTFEGAIPRKRRYLEAEKETTGRIAKNQAQKMSAQKKKTMKLVIGKLKRKQKKKKQQQFRGQTTSCVK